MFRDRAIEAQVTFLAGSRITAVRQPDDHPAAGALRWLVFWRIFEHFEIVFICAVVNIHFWLDVAPALFAVFPMAGMAFSKVGTTERIAPVIARATVARVGKQHVVLFVVADPLTATLGLDEIFGSATQATLWHARRESLLSARRTGLCFRRRFLLRCFGLTFTVSVFDSGCHGTSSVMARVYCCSDATPALYENTAGKQFCHIRRQACFTRHNRRYYGPCQRCRMESYRTGNY